MGLILRLFQYFRPYYLSCLLLMLVLLMASTITVATPFLYQVLIDKGIFQQNKGLVILTVLLIAGALILQELLSLAQSTITLRMREGVFASLKRSIYRHMMSLSQRFFSDHHKGRLLSRMTSDVNILQYLFLDQLVGLLRNILVTGVILCVLLMIQWKMVVITMIFIPLLFVLYKLFRNKISALSRLNQEHQEKMTERLQEDLSAVKAIQSFSVVDARAKETSQFMAVAEAARKKLDMQYAAASSSTIVINIIGVLVIWGIGAIEVIEERLTIGQLVAISFFLNYAINMFYSSYYTAMQLQGSIPSAQRIFEVLDTQPEIEDGHTESKQSFCHPAVMAMENVSFAYPEGKSILNKVNAEFRSGECVALIGGSGEGKTTIADLLQRFVDPQEGRITLDGIDIRTMKLNTLRKTVVTIPQEDQLMNDSIRNNIVFFRDGITESMFQQACEKAQVSTFAEQQPEGYETVIGERGTKLSGGQRKRIAIARALLEDPAILILDEATAMLDEETEQAVLQTITALSTEKMILMITHKASILSYADRIIRIKDGRLEYLD